MRIGIDAMGSDRAPAEEVRGALAARELLGKDDRLVLIGIESAIRERLDGAADWQSFIDIRHAEQVIRMGESPVGSLRAKPDSSIAVLTEMHKHGEVDACISAGNTGAFVASAQMRLRRLEGVHRPGLAILVPTRKGPVAVCDVGATVDCRPLHLHQFAVMAGMYVSAVCGVANPRIGLMSVGEEDSKGNELVKATRELLRADRDLNFAGNVESRDLFRGKCDVMVCDGFVGNVFLKLMEAMAEGVIQPLVAGLAAAIPQEARNIVTVAKGLLGKYDFNEYGGAPLLGVNGICVKCHGASDWRAIKNAIRAVEEMSRSSVNRRITELLSKEAPHA